MEWFVPALLLVALVLVIRGMFRGAKNKAITNIPYLEAINHEKSLMLRDGDSASLPVLNSNEYGYRPVGNESLIAIQSNVQRIEFKSTGKYSTQGSSISIPIIKGIRYRIGAGSIKSQKSWQVVANGRLVLTDKALAFEGTEKNERITWNQLADAEIMIDGFKISKRTGSPRIYSTSYPDPKFSAALELMLARVG